MFSPSWRKVRVMAFLPSLALPLLRLLPAETAHRLTIAALSAGFAPKSAPADDPRLASTLWGLRFPNPIGMAAGFDKNGEAYAALLRYGFGFTEIGTVTPLPQAGNPKPRLFRLRADQAIINRMGFNNDGLKIVAARLAGRNSGQGVVGGNLGKNRETLDPIDDYRRGVASLGPFVDYLVVNVSSPNTPGLRDLQRRSEATALIEAVLARRDELGMNTVPVLLKVAPDLSEPEVEEIAGVTLATKIDGLIVSNTTTSRPPSLRSRFAVEPGDCRATAVRAVDRAAAAALCADQGEQADHRRRRYRIGTPGLCEDPGRRFAGPALQRFCLSWTRPGDIHQA